MIYEERIYTVAAGKLAAVEGWFADHALPLLSRHGFELVGFWQTAVGRHNFEFVYLLRFADMNERMHKWDAFLSDPEWLPTLSKISNTDGETFVTQIENKILIPARFSPLG